MTRLFDEANGLLLLDEMVFACPGYQAIIEDQVITDEVIEEQVTRVIALFKKIDGQLNTEDKELVLKTICELAVLYEINAFKGGNTHGI